ncbi:MAG: hypothetical protein VX642_03180 [Bdellovibrionota bacterium]|nr:hypothetical protein [Bdellovibrionota bacterium]
MKSILLGLLSITMSLLAHGELRVADKDKITQQADAPEIRLAHKNPLVVTNPLSVLTEETRLNKMSQFVLEPGLYEIKGASGKGRTSHYFLLERSVDNHHQYYAMIFPTDLRKKGVSRGYLMHGTVWPDKTKTVFSRLLVKNTGLLAPEANLSQDPTMKHLVITKGYDKGAEYYITGSHPLLNKITENNIDKKIVALSLVPSRRKVPSTSIPKPGVFGDPDDGQAFVHGDEFNLPGYRFSMIAQNGYEGSIVGLAISRLNLMARGTRTESKYTAMVSFLLDGGFWHEDALIYYQPITDLRQGLDEYGEFDFYYYPLKDYRNLFEMLGDFFEDLFS